MNVVVGRDEGCYFILVYVSISQLTSLQKNVNSTFFVELTDKSNVRN